MSAASRAFLSDLDDVKATDLFVSGLSVLAGEGREIVTTETPTLRDDVMQALAALLDGRDYLRALRTPMNRR